LKYRKSDLLRGNAGTVFPPIVNDRTIFRRAKAEALALRKSIEHVLPDLREDRERADFPPHHPIARAGVCWEDYRGVHFREGM
jgi:hypothetical protein